MLCRVQRLQLILSTLSDVRSNTISKLAAKLIIVVGRVCILNPLETKLPTVTINTHTIYSMGSPYIEAKYLPSFNFDEDDDLDSVFIPNGIQSPKISSPILEVRNSPKSKASKLRRLMCSNRGNTELNVRIYTDWANHYLEKARYKRFITDLQVDICDGVLLADIIQAVTNQTVQDIHSKPSSVSQMVENVSTCLSFLSGLGVNVDGLSARDIKDGNLKAILGLFFSLSRFKQQQKSQSNTQNHNISPASNIVVNGNTSSNQLALHGNQPSGHGNNLNANGNPDVCSRLPSPQKTNSKCSTVSHSNKKDNITQGRHSTSTPASSTTNLNKLSKCHYSSLERANQQLTCPNNNLVSTTTTTTTANSGSLGKQRGKESSRQSGIPSRSSSPNPRSIPVRGNRSLGPSRPASADKNSNRIPSGSSSLESHRNANSTQASRPASASASTGITGKDKSMLDKFKLFKDKGDKSKGSGGKSKNGTPPPPPVRVSSATDKSTSRLATTPEGATGGASTPATNSPKLGLKLGKKGFGRSGKKEPVPVSAPQAPPTTSPSDEPNSRRASSASSSIPSRTASTTSVSSTTSTNAKKTSGPGSNREKSDSSRANASSKLSASSQGRSKSASKNGNTTPSGSSSGSSLTATSPTGGSGIPKPGTGSSLGRQGKDAKMKIPSSINGKSSGNSIGRNKDNTTTSNTASSTGTQGHSVHQVKHPNISQGHCTDQSVHGMPSSGHPQSQVAVPKELILDPKQSITKSVKVNNTNFAQQDVSPEKIMTSAHDKNANIRAASGGMYHNTSSHSNLRDERLNNSRSLERSHGARTLDKLPQNLSPGVPSNQHSVSPNNSVASGHMSKVPNKMAASGSHGNSIMQSPQKVDSDTQTAASVVQSHAMKQQQQKQHQQHLMQQQQQMHHMSLQQQQQYMSQQHQLLQQQQQQQQHQGQYQKPPHRGSRQQISSPQGHSLPSPGHHQGQPHDGMASPRHQQQPGHTGSIPSPRHAQQQQQQQQLPSHGNMSGSRQPVHHGSLPSPRQQQHGGVSSPPYQHQGSLPSPQHHQQQQAVPHSGPPQADGQHQQPVAQIMMPKAHPVVQMGKAQIQQPKYHNAPKVSQNPVPQNTQTVQNNIHGSQGSPKQSPHPRDQRHHLVDVNKKQSNSSLSSAGDDSNVSSSNSTSNSNNSASSTDSVIYRPSSCDEVESGVDSDANLQVGSSPVPPLDHISSLRQQKRDKDSPQRNLTPRRVETTFDAEVKTEEKNHAQPSTPKETTLNAGEETDSFDVDIKPMQPLMRSTPYAYLRNLPLLRPSLHIPTLSNQNQGLATSASSRLGVNRPLIDPSKLYTNSMKRTMSHSLDTDYGSDIEGFDVAAGYMSDGDILRSSRTDDINSGYMSEGGASLYAKRMQQRFREGIMAVKECMQKSSAMPDDDSFDDSSSVSSGDISDTINDISTDDNITGTSLSGTSSERSNPYGSLKRAPTGAGNNVPRSLAGPSGNLLYGKPSNTLLGRNLNVHGRDNLDNILGENWKKYTINEGGSSGAYGPDGKERNDLKYARGMPGAMFIKKKSNQATITDLRSRSLHNPQGSMAVAVEDPQLEHGHDGAPAKQKRDIETNTDHSMMMRHGARPQAGPAIGGFGFRRPLSTSSNTSNSSNGSRTSRMDAEALKGERLSNYNKGVMVARPGTAPAKTGSKEAMSDMGPEAYSASTLERKKKGALISKSQTNAPSYQSLDRKRGCEPNLKDRMFGSRSSLNKLQHQAPDGATFNGTIISNPHATYSKGEKTPQKGDYSPEHGHNYVNINYLSPDGLPPHPMGLTSPGNGYSWPKSNSSALSNGMRMALSETESMESLSSTASSSIQAQIQQARASALVSRNILHGANMGLQRSDSFKSTKSEKVFPTSSPDTSGLQRTNSFSHLCAGSPGSPTQKNNGGLGYALSGLVSTTTAGLVGSLSRPSSAASSSTYANVFLPLSKLSSSKDDDLHGSSLSLVSSSSSVYSTAEEKQNHEIRKLRRELEQAQEKVSTLTNQLTTNAHVVAAFEQSLSNMTQRLQALTCTAEAKDSELAELRATIEALKQQSGISLPPDSSFSPSSVRRQSSNASGVGKESVTPGCLGSESNKGLTRHQSTDSVSSLNSMSSACSATSQQSSATDMDKDKKGKKKKNWLRSSFSKAFSRKKNGKGSSMSDAELDNQSIRSDASVPNSPLLAIPHPMSMPTTPIKTSNSSGMLSDGLGRDDAVLELQQQLHEKDMKLTEIRLESLSSVHQLEQLRETMNRMKNEMVSLKADNERLHRLVSAKGLSPTSPTPGESLEKRLSLGDPSSLDLMLTESPDRDGRRITLSVFLNGTSDFCKLSEGRQLEVLIGAISVSGKTKWDMLDSVVRRAFKEYILRIDPVTNLGLNGDSVLCYNVADIVRYKDSEIPELLPCGYLVGENTNISITLKGSQQNCVDNLSFETLIPKSIVQRYISLLMEHKRIILCGPSGTGKTFLAQKLAEYLVQRSGKEVTAGAIATFNVDHKSSKELRQYLANIADQCDSTAAGELPNVIILDNLHHVSSLGEVFNGFLSVKHHQCPYIIGTMNQTTCSTTNLQLHHNFRWVLCANHMEPVKGFLGRYLRRNLVQEEVKTGLRNKDLNKVTDWVPKVWQHLNKFLETHSSSDVTIGPRLFLSCPMDVAAGQVWFTDLWNYSIVPYLLEAVREGIQLYGRRAPWEDPSDWVIETYPWTKPGSGEWPTLLPLRPEDVGYDTQGAPPAGASKAAPNAQQSDVEGDPLMNMLMRLQEAASYSSPQSNDSDSTSLDSHSSAQDYSTQSSCTTTTTTASSNATTNSSIESTI